MKPVIGLKAPTAIISRSDSGRMPSAQLGQRLRLVGERLRLGAGGDAVDELAAVGRDKSVSHGSCLLSQLSRGVD